MHTALERFSIAIEGEDCDLAAMFVSDAMAYFRHAKFYDRSARVIAAVKDEMKLGKSEYASPEGRAAAARIEQNLKYPPPVDVTVSFQRIGGSVNVMVIDKQSSRILSFDLSSERSRDRLDSYSTQIIRAITLAH
jgi:hypothetical protein